MTFCPLAAWLALPIYLRTAVAGCLPSQDVYFQKEKNIVTFWKSFFFLGSFRSGSPTIPAISLKRKKQQNKTTHHVWQILARFISAISWPEKTLQRTHHTHVPANFFHYHTHSCKSFMKKKRKKKKSGNKQRWSNKSHIQWMWIQVEMFSKL